MGPRVWVPALLISFSLHALALVSLVQWAVRGPFAEKASQVGGAAGTQALVIFMILWSVLMGIWSAMVANVLSKRSNVWGGISGLRLFGMVAGLTLALDVFNSPCVYTCPSTILIAPILSYVAIFNNAMPPPEGE